MSSYVTPGGLLALGSALPVLGLVVVGLRFFARRLQKAPLLLDDWLIIPAELLLIALGIFTIIGVRGRGLGYPIPAVIDGVPYNPLTSDPAVYVLSEKMQFYILMLCCLQLGFAKTSILFFYRRIFCSAHWGGMGIVTAFTITMTVIWSISFFFANLFECGTHFQALWSSIAVLETTNCINLAQLNESYVYSDFILDVMIFVMPIYDVWKLRMSAKRRIGIIAILCLGALTIIASTIKIVIITDIEHSVSTSLSSSDPEMLGSTLVYWTMLESGLATIVACLPTLPTLWKKSPDLLRSLRSKFSLHSLTSSHGLSRTNVSDSHSASPRAEMAKIDRWEAGMGSEAYALETHQAISV